MKKMLSFILFILLSCSTIYAQKANLLETGRISLSAGLSTFTIIGDNPNKDPINVRDESSSTPIGGSFNGIQPALSIRLNIPLDSAGTFIMPIGYDQIFYSANERVPYRDETIFLFHHTINVSSITTGCYYYLRKFSKASVRVFFGLDLRYSYIPQGNFQIISQKNDGTPISDTTQRTKSDAFRVGCDLRAGFEGRIVDPLFLLVNTGVGVFNLIGRNDARGDLLTPFTGFDSGKESLIYNFYFSLMLQYKF